ncbi:hypothetical protein ACIA5D_40825 [Actinoplanes sp. NPDC051513]|uniref:hypothetical protein n=1 Tax=Actinoplanes sp. NPDC051513 TaxID=3363908 RepID=UPI0037B7CED1
MTTQLPYDPTQPPPYQYGGLMVPHPELIHAATRPTPSWGPVAAWTFFTGPFGVIPAARRAGKAKRARQRQHPYWIAFGVTLLVTSVLSLVALNVGLRVLLNVRQSAVEKTIEGELRSAPAAKGVRITAADCTAMNQKAAGGLDAYACDVTLSTGKSGTVTVLADGDGTVKAVRQN